MCQKKFEELKLRDDFMFGKVMRNKAICKKTLEVLLGIQIEDIDYPETQKAINITYQGKSVRLDVYVEDDEHSVYNAKCSRRMMMRTSASYLSGADTIIIQTFIKSKLSSQMPYYK